MPGELEEERHLPDESAGFRITQGSLELAACRGSLMSVTTERWRSNYSLVERT